jgi:four helix bundle protein
MKTDTKKRMYDFSVGVIRMIDSMQPNDLVARRLSDQLIRSSTSIVANYVEGLSGSSKKDLANFFRYSLKSCNESKLWICLLRDTKRITSQQAQSHLKELTEFSKILSSAILTLKGERVKPVKNGNAITE